MHPKNVYPCKPQFYYIKVGCKGCTSHGRVILMVSPSVIFVVYKIWGNVVAVLLVQVKRMIKGKLMIVLYNEQNFAFLLNECKYQLSNS